MPKYEFASTVNLFSSTGKYLGHVPARKAERFHVTGGASIQDQRGNVVRGIRLSNPIGEPRKSCTPPSIHQYMGQHYTHREKIGGNEQFSRLVQFNYIDPGDRDLFRLSVLDNLVLEPK